MNVQEAHTSLTDLLRNKYSIVLLVESFIIFTYDLRVNAFMLNHLCGVSMLYKNTVLVIVLSIICFKYKLRNQHF
jgi:hypothetical protein